MKKDFIKFENISFGYGETPVVKDFNLEIEEGSFTTLLGSSGCGKTTLLRLVAGFLEPNSGKIYINDEVQNGILPDKRKIGMVFQNYALFPHMTVEQNLLYGLKIKNKRSLKKIISDSKENKAKNKEMVLKTASALGLNDLLNRFPHELSGGQQQRVALGRSLVLEPRVLLMDEPLSSLDANLRSKVREELKDIQSKLGITTVYVTHDQEEAFFLSDKIAVINEGKVLQYGTGKQIYFEPSDEFVAEFVGHGNFYENGSERFVIRPEWLEICKTGKGDFTGKILGVDFLGDISRFQVKIEEVNKIFDVDAKTLDCEDFQIGQIVGLQINRKWKL